MKNFLPIVATSLSLTLVSVSAKDVKFKEFHGDPSKLTGSGVYRTHNPVNNGWGIWTGQGVGTLNVGYADYSFELRGTTLGGIEMSGKRDFGTRLVIGKGATLKFSLDGQQSSGIALRGKGPHGLNKLDVQDGAHVSFDLVKARTSAKGIESESKSSLNVWNGGTLYFRDIRSTGSNMDDHAVGIYNVHYEHPTIGSTVGYLDVNLTSNGRLRFDNIEANDGRAAGIESATLKLDFKDSEYVVNKIQSHNDSAYGAIVKSGVGDQSITYKLARSSAHYGTISGYWWGVGLEANHVVFDMRGRSSLRFDYIKSVIRDAIGISAESFQFRTNYNNSGNHVVFGNVVSERRHAKGIYARDVNIVLSNGNSLEFGTIKGRATAKGIDTERLKSRESYVTLAGDIKFRNIESAKEAYGVKVVNGKTMRVGEDSKISNFTNLAFDQVVGNEYAAVLDFTKNTQQGDQTLAITRANINIGAIKADSGRAYGIALWAANQRKITFDNQSSLNVREITGQAQSKLFFAANSDLEVQLNGRSGVFAERIWSRDDAAGFNARNGRIVVRDNSSSVFKRIKSENGNAQGFDAQNIHLEGYSASVGAELIEGRVAYGIKASERATITIKNGGEVWFSNIVSEGGDAYGIKAKNITMDLRDGGKFAIHDMRSNNGHTYGLYAEKQLNVVLNENSRLKLGERRTAGNEKNAYGVYLANGAYASFSGGGVIENISSSVSGGTNYAFYAKGAEVDFQDETRMAYGMNPATAHRYAVLNNGNASYEFGNTRFNKISGSDYTYGLYNNSGTMTIGGTLRFVKLVSKNNGGIIGVDNRDRMILQGDGSIVVGNNNTGQQYGIFNSQSGVEFKLGNMDINTRGNNAWGIGTASGVKTTYHINGQVTFDVRDQTGHDERKAFESRLVNLAFTNGSFIKFNANAGYVGEAVFNGNARIGLAGDAKTKRTGHLLQLREFKMLKANGHGTLDVVLYANLTRTIDTKNFDGRAYRFGKDSQGTYDSLGGSDRLVIEDTDNTNQNLKGNLRVVLDTLDTKPKFVVLAEVKNNAKDKIIFNGLDFQGRFATITTESGYDTANIIIRREDKGQTAYYIGQLPTRYTARIAQRNVDETVSSQFSPIATYAANMNSLNKRMGELRDNTHSHGVWTRVFSGQQTSKFGAEAKNTYTTVQAGYDYNLGSEMGSNNYLGLAFSYVDSKTEQVLNQANNTKTKSGEFALYFVHVQDSGLYTDTIAKVGYLNNTMAFAGDNKDYNVTNTAFSLSQEIGYRWQATEGFYITPQVEETFSYISGSELKRQKDSSALTSNQDALKMLRTRVGLAGTYELPKIEEQFKANFHVGAFYTYDYMSGGETSMISSNQAQEKQSLESNGRFVLNLGTNFAVKDATRMYLDFEKSFGDKLSTDYQINVGVRYSFGQKTAKMDSVNKAPLKVEE